MLCIIKHPSESATESIPTGITDKGGFLIPPAELLLILRAARVAAATCGLALTFPPDAALPEFRHLCARAMINTAISGWLGKDFEKLNIVATYNLVYNAALMAEEGLGYVLTLDKLVNTSENGRLCFRPLLPKMEAHLNIVWKKYQVFSKAADLFLSRVQEAFHA